MPAGAAPAGDLPADCPAWLVGYRRLQVRYERRADILLGFVYLACGLICLKDPNQPNATGPSGS